jgi:hypothetical protein
MGVWFAVLTHVGRAALGRSGIRGRALGDGRRASGADGATKMRASIRSGNGRSREKAFAPSRSLRNAAHDAPTQRRLRAKGFMRNPKWGDLLAGR